MLRYSITRKCSALFHFPQAVVKQLTSDLLPVMEPGYYPVQVEFEVEVTGALGSSGALVPIKTLHDLILEAIQACPHLHDEVLDLARSFTEAVRSRLRIHRGGKFSPDLELKNCTLTFENGFSVKVEPQEMAVAYPIRFQHRVDFDLDSKGQPIKHGHHAQLIFRLALSDDNIIWEKSKFDDFVNKKILKSFDQVDFSKGNDSVTGELLLQKVAELFEGTEFKRMLREIRLQETSKNGFTLGFDKLP